MLGIGRDQQVPAVVVVEGKLSQPDNQIPVTLASLVLQPTQRDLDVLRAGGERLTQDGHVPRVAAVARAQIGHAARDLGRRGWISHESDPDRVHREG